MPARTLNDFFAGFFYAGIRTKQEAGMVITCKGQGNSDVKKINPSTFPGLKPGVCLRRELSRTLRVDTERRF